MWTEENSEPEMMNLDSGEIGIVPQWLWFSDSKPIPARLSAALTPRICEHVSASNPTDFLSANRQKFSPGGQILVLDGSEGKAGLIQHWLRSLRCDPRTSASPILVWSHAGNLPEFDSHTDFFSLQPDGVIGRRGWSGSELWIKRIESILRTRLKRHFHIDVHLDMSSRPDALEQASAWILHCVRLVPWMTKRTGRLRQAVFELGQNAIEWGNGSDASKTVHIRLRADDRSLHLTVSDQGTGFNRNHLPHAANEEDPICHLEVREQLGLRDGGFGILITRGLVDKLAYNTAGNTVLVTLRHREGDRC
ncbi:MAG: ATP-binding protein [Planctomycetota bacterium]|nr:ATP-binding protein [Planctomycetota bacterium]